MKLSHHAWQRWVERFPHLILGKEIKDAATRKASKRQLNSLRKRTALVKDYAYKISRNGVVFVVTRSGNVVTVFSFEEPPTYSDC